MRVQHIGSNYGENEKYIKESTGSDLNLISETDETNIFETESEIIEEDISTDEEIFDKVIDEATDETVNDDISYTIIDDVIDNIDKNPDDTIEDEIIDDEPDEEVDDDVIDEMVTEDIITQQITEIQDCKDYIKVNEEIEDTKQGNIGDCWLISGLVSLSYTEEGRKIIDDAITVNSDEEFTVTFNGINKSYTITAEEILNSRGREYSYGDDDVVLMELAVEKALNDIKDGVVEVDKNTRDNLIGKQNEDNVLNGGYFSKLTYLLTGRPAEYRKNNEKKTFYKFLKTIGINTGENKDFTNILDKIEKNPEAGCSTMGFYNKNGEEKVIATDVNGNEVILTYGGGHAWSIKSVEGDCVTLTNPWDSSIEVTLTKEEIEKHPADIDYFEF